MFAYCLNDPVNGCDPCGYCTCAAGGLKNQFASANKCPTCGHVSGGGAVLLPSLISADEVATGVAFATSYVYRKFVQAIKATAYGMMPDSYPVIHHIIPYGSFSRRSPEIKNQLYRAQRIMIDAGINPETDLINQMLISSAYHRQLHTDAYIALVTAPIVALGKDATKDQIYQILYDLRILIAASDQYSWG